MNKLKLQSLSFVLILLLLPLYSPTTCAAQSAPPAPRIFFTDLDSAPNSGGENVNGFAGAYVTLYGNFLGASQGSSTVTWNGENCLRVVGPSGSYSGWGASHFWYQKIIVQLGSACTAGAGNFVVTVNGAASNGVPFTVRSSGKLLFVSSKGNDSNSGSFASPFATIPQCKSAMKAGDVCYIEDGVTATTVDNFDATLELESGGTAGNPVAFVGYPGAKATLGASGITYGLRVPNTNVSANYVTVAGLFFSPSEQGMNPTNSSNWRVVGNNFQCPTANGEDGCFTTNEISSIKFLGNEATNIGVVAAGKQQHAVYFSSDTNHVESAWNYIHDNRSCRAMQFHSSPLGGGGAGDTTGHNQFDLSVHDNLIHDDPCDGINFATVDPSQGRVEAYNNVIYHVGIGPTPQDGDSGDYSCIYMAYITNTGPVGGGAVEIYNNTLYDCGPFVASFPNNGSFMINGGEPGLQVRIRNNIVYQFGNEPFGSGSGWNATYVSGSNNIMHSTVSLPLPSFLSGSVTSDPLFADLSLNNFHLQSASPAKDAGITISSGNTYNNYMAWNGNPADHEGVLRSQGANYDIGAYEFYAGSAPPPPPPPVPSLQSLAVAPGAGSIAVGSTIAFTTTGHYSDGSTKNVTAQAAWSSSNSSVATIGSNTGVATGVAAGGPVTITASLSGVTGTASLTVTAPPLLPTLQSITVTPSPDSIAVGSTVVLAATGHYSDGSNKNLTTQAAWSSSNSSVATVVSNTGVAAGMAAGGPVTINASMSGIKGAASLTVTSASAVSVVNFDSPAPSGSPYSSINGTFGGINFGVGQWAWEPGYLSDATNNIYFSSATSNKRTFSFANGSHVLISMKVATSVAGTLTLSDGAGQTKTQNVSTGGMQLVTTGWKNASRTITVTFTGGWNIEFDDITYR